MHSFTNTKGFKIIKTSVAEVRAVGGYGLCDDWNKYAKFYEEDVEFETQMHDNWIKIFKEKGII